jgi:hypothetical protein
MGMIQKRIRQARSELLWGLGAFAVLQLGLAAAIAGWLPQLRDPYYGEKLVRLLRRRDASPGRPLTVIMLGSSRTLYGLKAGSLEEELAAPLGRPVVCFNFGIPSAGPVTELLMLKRLQAEGIHPDLLLVEVLPYLLAWPVPNQELEAGGLPIDRLGWRDLPLLARYSGPGREALRRDWWQGELVPWHTHRLAILNRVAPRLLPLDRRVDGFWSVDRSGYLGTDWETLSPAVRRRALESARRECASSLTGFVPRGPASEGLREILAVCQGGRIPAALVLMPEGPEFRSWYPPGTWEQIQSYLDGLSRDWEVPLINAREWLAEDDFLDSHHMLARGAARFTERFGHEALLPLVRAVNRPSDQRMAGRGQGLDTPRH